LALDDVKKISDAGKEKGCFDPLFSIPYRSSIGKTKISFKKEAVTGIHGHQFRAVPVPDPAACHRFQPLSRHRETWAQTL